MKESTSGKAPSDERTVDQTIEIAAPPDAVWRALTDADELVRWFPLEARVQPEAGGTVWMRWNDQYQGASRIEVWEPGTHLRIAFPLDGPGAVVTDYYLRGSGGRTTLRVVTSGFGDGTSWDDFFDGVRFGWTAELCGLRHYLERHRGEDRRVVWIRVPYRADRADAWRGLVGPAGWQVPAAGAPMAAGQGYALQDASGSRLTGTTRVWEPPALFVGTVDRWNDALLRIETWRAPALVSVWLSAYGVGERDLRAIEEEWQAAIEAAVGGGAEPPDRRSRS